MFKGNKIMKIGLRWCWIKGQWELKTCFGLGRSIATVFKNGVWHTWNKNGSGGENWKEDTLIKAMEEARLSAIMQGFD